MARLYSARPKAVVRGRRPRAAWLGWSAGRAAGRRQQRAGQRGREPDAHSAGVARLQLHDVRSGARRRGRGSSRWRTSRRRRRRPRSPCWIVVGKEGDRRPLRRRAPAVAAHRAVGVARPALAPWRRRGSRGHHEVRRLPLQPARDDVVGRQRVVGPISTRSMKQQPAGLRNSITWIAGPGHGDRRVVRVVGELPFAVEIDVDVLGRRSERERSHRCRPRARPRRRRARFGCAGGRVDAGPARRRRMRRDRGYLPASGHPVAGRGASGVAGRATVGEAGAAAARDGGWPAAEWC